MPETDVDLAILTVLQQAKAEDRLLFIDEIIDQVPQCPKATVILAIVALKEGRYIQRAVLVNQGHLKSGYEITYAGVQYVTFPDTVQIPKVSHRQRLTAVLSRVFHLHRNINVISA